jgi:2-oxoisovalerate dehydrogenase E2 component (dihydrolipoyl transacylase)
VTVPDFRLPDLGEGLAEAEVIAWHVKPGDHVTVDQVIAEVETAKAVVEVPVPYAGVVTALHAEPGGVVSVGQPLITVTADQAVTANDGTGFREPGVAVPEQGPSTADRGASGAVPDSAGSAEADREEASGSVLIGYGTTAAPARSGRRGRRRGAAVSAPPSSAPLARASKAVGLVTPDVPPPAASTPVASVAPPAAPASPGGAPGRHPRVAVISPLVRKEARDAGLDLTSLAGTGPAGVISR